MVDTDRVMERKSFDRMRADGVFSGKKTDGLQANQRLSHG
jgi:hypothetical protein